MSTIIRIESNIANMSNIGGFTSLYRESDYGDFIANEAIDRDDGPRMTYHYVKRKMR